MAKKKFYAVAKGHQCGIFTDWGVTEQMVKGFAGAKYKSFPTREEAEQWLKNPLYAKKSAAPKKVTKISGTAADVTVTSADPENCVLVFTDGGAINNPGPGGYGVVIEMDGKVEEYSGGFRRTTNNRMEMTAAIEALTRLKGCTRPVILTSDSSYLVNGISKGWVRGWQKRGWRKSDGGAVLNVDLWQRLVSLLEELDVQFRWVKGHAGHPQNERCDQLAVAMARSGDLPVDSVYESSES